MTPDDIRDLRRRYGWTQADLASKIGTDPVTVSRWERGATIPRPSARARLRDLAGSSPEGELSRLMHIIGSDDVVAILRRAELRERRPASDPRLPDLEDRLEDVDDIVRAQAELKARLVG